MKILVVAPYYYPHTGGTENYIHNIAKGLRDTYKCDMTVVTTLNKGNKAEEYIQGIKIIRMPCWFKVSNTPINPLWILYMWKIFRSEDPDIINAHTPVPIISDIACIIAFILRKKFILTYHNDIVAKGYIFTILIRLYYKTFGYLLLKCADRIIVTSAYYMKKSGRLNAYSEKISIVSPGVDTVFFSDKNTNSKIVEKFKGTKNILFVGQLDKTHNHKGLDYLLKAFRFIREKVKNYRLIIVGTGDMNDEYRKKAKEFVISDSVIFTGFVSNTELPSYYSASDILVLPSVSDAEGFGMVILEAAALGKPAIGTRIGGIPSVIQDGKTGYLVPPRDEKALARKIIQLLSNPNTVQKFGENAYKMIQNSYTWDKKVKDTYGIFRGLTHI